MIVIVDPNDRSAVRNKDNVLALYDMMIGQGRALEATRKFLVSEYVQHNPIVPDGAAGLGGFFNQIAKQRSRLRVVVHRIIAHGDWVWAHVNFINLFNDDTNDRGLAGVDIYKMDAEGRAVEHWDVLQEVGDPTKAVHANGMF